MNEEIGMVFAKAAFAKLNRAREIGGGQLPQSQWLRIVAELYAENQPRKLARRKAPINKMTEDEFVDYLENDPALAGVDIKKELGRCQFYWKGNNKEATRKHIINWMLKAERVVVKNYDGTSSFKKPVAIVDEPENWRIRMLKEFPGNVHSEDPRPWKDIGQDSRKTILEALARIGP
jgi:hypothetical protein